MNDLPDSFKQLKGLNRKSLKKIHMDGCCPNLKDLDGVAKGMIFDPTWFEYLRLWRGKAFEQVQGGTIRGKNILGLGLLSFKKYQFDVSIRKSAFSDQNVAYINHDYPSNPMWVRQFHDEMVELHPGFYLACSHYKAGDSLKYMSYFAFNFR